MRNVRERVFYSLNKLKERMQAEYTVDKNGKEMKPKLHSSVIGNIIELVELLPYLNIDNDPKLEDVRRKMEEEFADLSIDTLKEDEELKKEVAAKATEIINNLKGIL